MSLSACSAVLLKSSFNRVSKQILKQLMIISHTLSLVRAIPSGLKMRVFSTWMILNRTTPSEDWSAPTNLACVTASAILSTIAARFGFVGSKKKKNHWKIQLNILNWKKNSPFNPYDKNLLMADKARLVINRNGSRLVHLTIVSFFVGEILQNT
jgi:hypothetical protein